MTTATVSNDVVETTKTLDVTAMAKQFAVLTGLSATNPVVIRMAEDAVIRANAELERQATEASRLVALQGLAVREYSVEALGGAVLTLPEIAQQYVSASRYVGRKIDVNKVTNEVTVTFRNPSQFSIAVSGECYQILVAVQQEVGKDLFKMGFNDLEHWSLNADRYESAVGWIEAVSYTHLRAHETG
jgi:hypothetical protein